MMNKDRSRLVERLPSLRIQLQAQIDIIKGDRKIRFVEPAHREKLIPCDKQACRGHRTDTLRQPVSEEVSSILIALKPMRMRCAAANSGNNAGVLDRSVRV